MFATAYPVLEILPLLRQALASHNTVILQAPPGAGKSTVLPIELMKEPWLHGKKIIMLEPRRLAARSVANRMAFLLNEEVGERVGYRIRFDTKVSEQTQLEVVTEGILTRMIQHDSELRDVGLIIFDEFHERSLQSDLAFALGHQVQHVLRNDLRLLIMSATLQASQLTQVLGKVPVITSEGKQFPVAIRHVPLKNEQLTDAVTEAIRKVVRDETGDILVFLPGTGEIQRVAEQLNHLAVVVHPLYGDLSPAKQDQAIQPDPSGRRKIVLATSIAETSLTIEGIKVVIDAGYARVPRFDPRSGLTRLVTERVTLDSANQRAGRAGRLGPGTCYRLWLENLQLSPQRKPEILEADLSSLMLELLNWGVIHVNDLRWITPPPAGAVSQALDLLESLKAIENKKITPRGKEMLRLPTHPRIAHLLLEAAQLTDQHLLMACDVAAILEERDPMPKESGVDLALRVEALRHYRTGSKFYAEASVLSRIEKISLQWRKIFQRKASDDKIQETVIGRLLLEAYPDRIAQQQEKHSNRYKLANGRMVKLPPHDPLAREPWLCVAQLDAGDQEGKIFLAAAIDVNDVLSFAQVFERIFWDEERGAVAGVVEQRVGSLVLSSKPLTAISEEQRLDVLLKMIREKDLRAIGWNEWCDNWQARVTSLAIWRKGENWPAVDEEALLKSLEVWLAPFLTGITKLTELQKLDWPVILPTLLPWELQTKLNQLAPEKIQVPSGSALSLQYFNDGSWPVLKVRLQEMFGLANTPEINEGRTKILLHLLSPGYKPVQVTQDLKSFWHTAYHEVRKELRIRYPKHHWPEDPWTAQAVRGVKRKPAP